MSTIDLRRIRDQISERLREDILIGELPQGEPLRESVLAHRFGVSRVPVRDAIIQLTAEGLLLAEPNRGARVSPEWDESLRPVLINVRRDIEMLALQKMMARITDEDVSRIRANLAEFAIACRNEELPAVVRLDMAFHRLIIRGSNQPGLEAVWLPLMGGMRLPYGRHRSLLESHVEHERIVEAIERRDGIEAAAALRANIW